MEREKLRIWITLLMSVMVSVTTIGLLNWPYQAQAQQFTSCDNTAGINALDCQALVDLYNDTDGLNWTIRTDWLVTNTPCEWYGVICNEDRVWFLQLPNNNLNGNLSESLGNLSDLIILDLSSNGLNSPIPPEIGHLTNLIDLWLYDNDLRSSLPISLTNLVKLNTLLLHDNRLSGIIPPEIGQLTQLAKLQLNHNQFSGEIPVELSQLDNLIQLDLSNNRLIDSIPISLTALSKLQLLHLQYNFLEGEIPSELGNLNTLKNLSLGRNRLAGSIPVELGQLSELEDLRLYNNNFTGKIPSELENLSNLTYLDLYDNELTGEIPLKQGQLLQLKKLDLGKNQLTGEVPLNLLTLPELKQLYIDHNKLSGRLPNFAKSRTIGQQLNHFWFHDNAGLCEPSDLDLQVQLALIKDLQRAGLCESLARYGKGKFQAITQSFATPNTQALAAGDFDGDGDIDLVVANGDNQPNTIWWGKGKGQFDDSGQRLGETDSRAVAVADFNGDDAVDIVFANYAQNSQVWLNNGQGIFNQSQTLPNTNQSDIVQTEQIDYFKRTDQGLVENKTVDVVLAGEGGVSIWLNDGLANFEQDQIDPILANTHPQALTLGNINRADNVDIVVLADGHATIWLNSELGELTQMTEPIPLPHGKGVALADLGDINDHYGLVDMVISNDQNQPDLVWWNELLSAEAQFVDSGQRLGQTANQQVILEDWDADGDKDAWFGGTTNSTIWFNDGQGQLTQAKQHLPHTLPQTMLKTDIDKDGDFDIVLATNDGQVWLNIPALTKPLTATRQITPTIASEITVLNSQLLTTTIQIPKGTLPSEQKITATYTALAEEPTNLPTNTHFAGQAFRLTMANSDGTSIPLNQNQGLIMKLVYDETIIQNPDALHLYYQTEMGWHNIASNCPSTATYQHDQTNHLLTLPICHLTEFALVELLPVYLPLLVK